MLWNKVTSSEVVSGHRKDFEGMKFNCKKPVLNITLKTISLLLLREKKIHIQLYVQVDGVFFKIRPQGEKLFSLLKDSRVFLASPISNPGKRKTIIPALLIGKLENGKILCATHFLAATGGNPWFPWMTEVTGRQHRGRKKKSQTQSAVSLFVSLATKPIPFSPFWCYSFTWDITGVTFGVCLSFPFFNVLSLTIRGSCPLAQVLYHWTQWLFYHQGGKTSWKSGWDPKPNRYQRSTKESKRERKGKG